MSVHELKNGSAIDTISKKHPALVLFFWANWDPSCKQMDQVVTQLASDHALLKFIKIEAEAFPDVTEKYPVTAVPTFIILRDGKVADKLEGPSAPKLVALVGKHTKAISAGVAKVKSKVPVQPDKELNTRLGKLTRAAPIMVFIKGSPSAPRCGFSRQIVEILKEENCKFGYFDILTDNDVRQSLKTFSNWPTYPQLYINGELIGGLDILKELREEDEFKDMIPKCCQTEDLNARIKTIINKHRCMVFMKGSPSEPKCGFSKTMIALLNEVGFEYGYFDILLDNDVRQGIKKYSNWPTFPSFYVDGELIGGLDVCKEMHEEGELADLVQKIQSK